MAGLPPENIEFEQDGDYLIVKIDLKRDVAISRTGKTVLVACSHGFNPVYVDGKPIHMAMNLMLSRFFEIDEPPTVQSGWVRRQDRK